MELGSLDPHSIITVTQGPSPCPLAVTNSRHILPLSTHSAVTIRNSLMHDELAELYTLTPYICKHDQILGTRSSH